MNDVVKIRGMKAGLQLIIDKNSKFEDVKAILLEKLESGNKFFIRGTTVYVDKDFFDPNQIEQLRSIFHRHGMLFSDKIPDFQKKFERQPVRPPAIQSETKIVQPQSTVKKSSTTRINRTLRGGEEIRTEDSVLVIGNVNPGAQIIAGGNIDVRGSCFGIVHAGAFGDKTAYIVADILRPTQIRIADLIGRSPDENPVPNEEKKDEHVSFKNRIAGLFGRPSNNEKSKKYDATHDVKHERASIKDGQIFFESIKR